MEILTAVHLKYLDHEKIEAIWLRIVTKSSSVTIGSFYRSPDNTAFFEDIVIPIEKAWYKYKNLVLVGDFNVNFSKTAHGHGLRLQEKLMSALVQFDCSVINKDFTRVTPTTETMIAKTEAMLIKRGTFVGPLLPVQLNGSLVKCVKKAKSLGVTLDNMLK